jgi:hypothetical protein
MELPVDPELLPGDIAKVIGRETPIITHFHGLEAAP